MQTSAGVGDQSKSQSKKKKDISDDYLNFDSNESDVEDEEEDEQAEEEEDDDDEDDDSKGP